MGSIRKRGSRWNAEVRLKGFYDSDTFGSFAEAKAWVTRTEADVDRIRQGRAPDKTVADLLARYSAEVSVAKRGARWERLRLDLLARDRALSGVALADLDSRVIADWRNRRLKQVAAGSVRREMTLLSHCFTVAVNEWRWLSSNPVSTVARPKAPPPRDRRITDAEIELVLHACGYDRDRPPQTILARCGAAFMFALETAMRAGEITNLRRADVRGAVAKVVKSKNGFPRDVPLSTEAQRILAQLPPSPALFDLQPRQLDANFRKAVKRTGIEDLKFHDSRHESITRLARRLDVLDLARMTGHRNINELRTYYNASAADIARLLA